MPNNNQQPSSGDDSPRNKPDGLPLVPKPPGALQKSVPGAKRILSGMVADTLALVVKKDKLDRVTCFVLVGDENETTPWIFDFGPILSQTEVFERYDFIVIHFSSALELLNLVQDHVFDLIVINLSGINWDKSYSDGGDSFDDVIEFLALIRTQYGKPIVVFSRIADARFSSERFAQIGVNFLNLPCTPEQVRAAFEGCLIRKSSEEILQPHQMRSRKIIHLDDADDLLDLHRAIIQRAFKNVEVVSFTDANEALQELSYTSPVLFITDLNMPKIDGFQVLSTLAEKGVKHPVMMLCGNMSDDVVKRAHEIAGPAMNFSYRLYPGSGDEISQFVQAVSKLIGVEPNLAAVPSATKKTVFLIDENPVPVELMEGAIRERFSGVQLRVFEDRDEGLRQLFRSNPDLLIIELVCDNHTRCDFETLKILADRRVSYPVTVTCGLEADVRTYKAQGLNITFLKKPFTLSSLLENIETGLQITRDQ